MAPNGKFPRPVEILLVEDSPTDADLTRIALQDGPVATNLHHVVDGVEALRFLRHEHGFETAPRPDLVLLDLKMPRMDGHQLLDELRGDRDLKSLVIVVLSTSIDDNDVCRAYDANVNLYIQKPVELEPFLDIVSRLEHLFFNVATLPTTVSRGE
ncbi:MAG: response regulator [Pirellulaceae bacterium]|nr:response regulator [Planctomycetales bacterium]